MPLRAKNIKQLVDHRAMHIWTRTKIADLHESSAACIGSVQKVLIVFAPGCPNPPVTVFAAERVTPLMNGITQDANAELPGTLEFGYYVIRKSSYVSRA